MDKQSRTLFYTMLALGDNLDPSDKELDDAIHAAHLTEELIERMERGNK